MEHILLTALFQARVLMSPQEYQPSTTTWYEYHQGVAPGKLFNQSKQNRQGSEKGGGKH